MKPDRTDIVCLIAVALHFTIVAIFYQELPENIPTHWNAAGQVDGYTAKPWGAWLFPLLTLSIFVLFKIIPLISPHGFRMESFLNIVSILKLVMVMFMLTVGVTVILAALRGDFDPGTVVLPAVGLLLVVLGNYMGKLRKNFFIGIRTPWTLASDEVWARTHRLGGWMFVLAGLVMIVTAMTRPAAITAVLAGIILTAALVPVVYSFIIYRRLEGLGPDREHPDQVD